MSSVNKKIFALCFTMILLISLSFFLKNPLKSLVQNTSILYGQSHNSNQNNLPKITINQTQIYVEVAKTPQQKSLGLSGRKSLDKSNGMLFVFENKTRPSFWMKGMNFAIDIIWIANGKIVGIEKSAPAPAPNTHDSKLPIYKPPTGIDYVLEVNAGFSDRNNLEKGSGVEISL